MRLKKEEEDEKSLMIKQLDLLKRNAKEIWPIFFSQTMV
jgi:hypothetical protein